MELSTLSVDSAFTESNYTVKYFTQGQCHALAWEVHKLTKWDLAIISDGLVGSPDYAGHAFIINKAGMAVDIRGVQTVEDFRKDWPTLEYFYRFRSPKEYKKEMELWEGAIAFNKDAYAKQWAKYIVELVG